MAEVIDSESRALVRAEDVMAPAVSVAAMVKRHDELLEFTKTLMTPEVDFGVIPGTSKPTLLKPGAEKLLRWHGLVVECRIMPDSKLDVAGDVLDLLVEGTAIHAASGMRLGTVHAAANSEERRYRNARSPGRKDKQGHPIEPATLGDQKNVLIKIAEKRVIVAAALLYTMASETYTQDAEDTDLPQEEKPAAPTAKPQTDAWPSWAPKACPKCKAATVIREGNTNDGRHWVAAFCNGPVRNGEKYRGCGHKGTFRPDDWQETEAVEQSTSPEDKAKMEEADVRGEEHQRLFMLWGQRGMVEPARVRSLHKFLTAEGLPLAPLTTDTSKLTAEKVQKALDTMSMDMLTRYRAEQEAKRDAEEAAREREPGEGDEAPDG
jgi:hypothetical protein